MFLMCRRMAQTIGRILVHKFLCVWKKTTNFAALIYLPLYQSIILEEKYFFYENRHDQDTIDVYGAHCSI